MLILFFALMAGYAIGRLMPKGDLALGICVPASIALYAGFRLLTTGIPDAMTVLVVGAVQAPILMLGVFLARRGGQRNSFESE